MKKLKEYWLIVLLVLIVLAVPFYWYSLRPSQIIKECNKWKEVEKWDYISRGLVKDGSWRAPEKIEISRCLREHGLKE